MRNAYSYTTPLGVVNIAETDGCITSVVFGAGVGSFASLRMTEGLLGMTEGRGVTEGLLGMTEGRGVMGGAGGANASVGAGGTSNTPSALTNACATQVLEFLAGKRRVFDVPFELAGSVFQKAVWEATLAIPYGQTRTASTIANVIGQPQAHRQAGRALAACPCTLLVPVHRVDSMTDALSVRLRAIEAASA